MNRSTLKYFYRGTAPHFLTSMFSFMLIGIYAVIGLNLTFVSPVVEAFRDFDITDICYKMIAEQQSHAITIVDLTDLESRREIAATLRDLESMNPRVIGMDAVFEGVKHDTLGNEILTEVAREYDNIVFASRIKEDTNGEIRTISSFFTDSVDVAQGVTNIPRSLYNGIKRTLRHSWECNGEKSYSIVDEIVGRYGIQTTYDGITRINFQPTRFDVLQPSDLPASRDLIEGRIILFGAMADEGDMHYTPLGKMAGVELLAYATQTMIEEKAVWKLPMPVHILLSIILVILSEYMIDTYKKWSANHKSPVVRYFMGSYYVISIWQFLWISFLMWMVLICFTQWNLAMDIGWTVSAIAMLSMGRSLRDSIEGYLRESRKNKSKRSRK